MWKIIDKIGFFSQNLFTALKFAAFDYDVVLRRTKTSQQRIVIWALIFTVVIGIAYLLLLLLGASIKNITRYRLIK